MRREDPVDSHASTEASRQKSNHPREAFPNKYRCQPHYNTAYREHTVELHCRRGRERSPALGLGVLLFCRINYRSDYDSLKLHILNNRSDYSERLTLLTLRNGGNGVV